MNHIVSLPELKCLILPKYLVEISQKYSIHFLVFYLAVHSDPAAVQSVLTESRWPT